MMKWDAISERLPKGEIILGAEVGVWQGDNAEKLLQMNPNLYLFLVDRWLACNDESYIKTGDSKSTLTQDKFDEAYELTVKKVSPFKERSSIYRMNSFEAANLVEDGSLHFAFLDANHSYEGVKADMDLWLPKIKKGGFICGHDWGVYEGVKRAVMEKFMDMGIKTSYDFTWFVQL